MFNLIWDFLSKEGFQPHGTCLLWRPDVFWAHMVSDSIIAVAYFSIPIALFTFAQKRKDLTFGWVLYLFAIFIVACGMSHVFHVWTMWVPDYGIEAIIKLFTAVVSLITAIALWPLIPKLLLLPSTAQLEVSNAALETEVDQRKWTERKLKTLNETLEQRVEERTRELQKMNDELDIARGEAERLSNVKSDFLATMSHEIRTPLNAISGAFELLNRADLPERQKKRVAAGQSATEKLIKQLTDVLEVSRLEANAVELYETTPHLATLLEEWHQFARATVSKFNKGVEVGVFSAPDVPERMQVDEARLTQVINNLIVNAAKFTNEGKIEIRLTVGRPKNMVTECLFVDIIDSGCGIAEEDISTIFERFQQVDGSITRERGGSVLGLSISTDLVRLMGGSLTVESKPGEGSTFRVALPIFIK